MKCDWIRGFESHKKVTIDSIQNQIYNPDKEMKFLTAAC